MAMFALAAKGGFDFAWWWDHNGIAAIVVLVVAILLTIVTRVLVSRFGRKLGGEITATQQMNLQRAATLTKALSATGIAVVWVVAVLWILGTFTNIAPLLASSAVVGVALGFGAQSLVKDGLSGFFILLENQLGVGDVVDLVTTGGTVSGKVEGFTFRVTSLRAFDGTIHIVPNGNIQLVSNKSRGWARAIVDVRVAYGEDVDRVRGILDELFSEFPKDPDLSDWIHEGPRVLGVETLADYGQTVRVVAETRPSKRVDVERQLRERISRTLADHGVKVPVPPAPSAR